MGVSADCRSPRSKEQVIPAQGRPAGRLSSKLLRGRACAGGPARTKGKVVIDGLEKQD